MKKILLLNGANLNLLGLRDHLHYGKLSLKEIETLTAEEASKFNYELIAYQSNHEGCLIDTIQLHANECDGIIINPGAFTHYSYALHDALLDAGIPAVEVHLSALTQREIWRSQSVTAAACIKVIWGKKEQGYIDALHSLMAHINNTQLNRVIGYPLNHTQSPTLHNTVYNLLDCNAVMLAQATDDLASTMQELKSLSVELIAVTMPYKKEIVQYLDDSSIEVKELNVANTIIRRNGKLVGYNTDIDGVAYALRHVSLFNKTVLIIGAGGASHAVAYYLKKNHAHLLWLNRTPQHAISMLKRFGGSLVDSHHLNDLPIDIIINTTPLGMFPDMSHTPLPNYPFKSNQVVFDMVYNPSETLLLKNAKSHGAVCISGLDMFIGQGLKQIELWLNKSISTAEIIDVIKSCLKNEVAA